MASRYGAAIARDDSGGGAAASPAASGMYGAAIPQDDGKQGDSKDAGGEGGEGKVAPEGKAAEGYDPVDVARRRQEAKDAGMVLPLDDRPLCRVLFEKQGYARAGTGTFRGLVQIIGHYEALLEDDEEVRGRGGRGGRDGGRDGGRERGTTCARPLVGSGSVYVCLSRHRAVVSTVLL